MNRRIWLQTAATALASPLAADDAPTCGLAIGTYGLQSLKLEDAIELIARTGYDALEITAFKGMTGDPSALSPTRRTELRQRIADAGLRLCALMADLRPARDEAEHRVQLAELSALFDLARALNPDQPPIIQTVLGGNDWEAEKTFLRDRVADWMKLAADQKVVVSIKPHRGSAMSTPDHGAWMLQQLGSGQWLRLVYDFSHYAFRDLPIADTVRTALPFTNYVAVKDAVEQDGKIRFALAGEGGTWDHADIIRAFLAGGYRGDFCCEVSSQIWRNNPRYDPVAATQLCHRNMAAAFARAGVSRA